MQSCCCSSQEARAGDAELVTRFRGPEAFGVTFDEASCAEGDAVEEWPSSSPVDGQVTPPREGGDVPAAKASESQDSSVVSLKVVPPPMCEQNFAVSLTFKDLDLLRATTVQHVLHRGAAILQDSVGTEKTYQLSRSANKIDVFISHNWVVPRHQKFWPLVFHFNLFYATVASYFGVAVGCLLDLLSVPPTLQNVDLVMRPHCLIFGSCLFLVALVFGHDVPMLGRLLCQQRLFLDKICINQSDPALKAAGIRSLGAFLKHSDRMLVLFQSVYVQKLWTVYELACFMYLHPRGKLDLLPLGIARVVLLSTTLVTILSAAIMAGQHFASALEIGSIIRTACVMVVGGPCITGLAFIQRGWALQQSELFSSLRSFEISKARCADESDRPMVYSNICAFVRAMGLVPNDASEDDALLSFDKLVQECLPQELRGVVGRTGIPYKYVLVGGISVGFYSCDVICSQPDRPAPFVASWLIYGFNIQTAVIPSIFLTAGLLVRKCPQQLGKWGELALRLGAGAAAFVVALSVYILSAFLRDKAILESWWLLPYAVVSAAQSLAVAKLF